MQTFTLLRDGEFELAILNVVTSNISWSVNRVDWLRFGESFVRGIMMIPEEGFPLRVYVGESDRHGPIYGKDSALSEDVSMVVDIVKGREKVGSFCPSWMEDHGRIGDVGTNKSS